MHTVHTYQPYDPFAGPVLTVSIPARPFNRVPQDSTEEILQQLPENMLGSDFHLMWAQSDYPEDPSMLFFTLPPD